MREISKQNIVQKGTGDGSEQAQPRQQKKQFSNYISRLEIMPTLTFLAY
jgi:hypothetical protein